MKLYTEEQVKMLLEKMSLVTERKNIGVSANFRHRGIEIDKLLKGLTPIELPTDEEIFQKSIEIMEEWYGNGCETEIDGHFRGAKWMRDKILNK